MPHTSSSAREYFNYPYPVKAKDTPYCNAPEANPALSGVTLTVLSHVVARIGTLRGFLWNNAGFGTTRLLEKDGILRGLEPSFDPTVVPLASNKLIDVPSPFATLSTASPDLFYSSSDYISAYKAGIVTPTQIAERILDIFSTDRSKEHYLIEPTPRDVLLKAAAASTERYKSGTSLPLDGVPLIVKDEVDVANTHKTMGLSPAQATRRIGNELFKESSFCVKKLLDAGMVFIGKSNMHELGLDTTGDNPNWGTPVNPYNAKYYPGGSSGGSGASVGAGIVPIAVGADGGGSIRIPATYNGVWGIKPSHGRVSARPTPSLAPSVGVIGPIAATISDLEVAFRLMATPDREGGAASSLFTPPGLDTGENPRLLGIYKEWFEDCDPLVLSIVKCSVDKLCSEKGYQTVSITLPYLSESRTAHAMTIMSDISAGTCAGGHDTTGLTAHNRILMSISSHTTAYDLLNAARLRTLMMQHLSYLYQTHPGLIIVTPTLPHVGVPIPSGAGLKGSHGVSDANAAIRSMRYVFLANWTGCPAISAPCGYVEAEGGGQMPIGLMGMAEWGAEDMLLAFGKDWDALWSKERKRGAGWVDVLKT